VSVILPELHAFQTDDLRRVLDFAGTCCAITDFESGFHPGDISHFISNSLRGRDPSKHVFFTEDEQGQITVLVWVQTPRYPGFEVMIHPNQRGGDFEAQVVEWAENAAIALAQAENADAKAISTEIADSDAARINVLIQRGYEPDAEPFMMFTTRSLEVPIPESVLPEGFSIRPVAGEHEVALVSEVHDGAFNSKWQPDEYLKVMRSPAFDIERERVVVAPDGRFAAFTVLWFDPISQSALFEPVGCHPDFQRRGLTRALMYEGMRRMVAQGMKTAIVAHLTDNPASSGLYASLGFAPKRAITSYTKTLQASL
jgi:ribosomal protein S18 acetylase RimI-like enzyme